MPNWKKVIVSGSDAALNTLNVSTSLTASGLIYPTTDGTTGQVLTTDGAGNITFSNVTTSITASAISSSYIDLDPLPLGSEPAYKEGRIFYSSEDGALSVYNSEADITLQVGQEFYKKVKNGLGSPILNGTPVRISGSLGGNPLAYPATSQDHTTGGGIEFANHIIGIATHDIGANGVGFVTELGTVNNVNTLLFTAGDTLYLQTGSPATPAEHFRNSPPPFPYDIIQAGTVLVSNATTGKIEVNVKEPIHFANISGLSGSASSTGELFIYEDSIKNAWSPGRTFSGSYTFEAAQLDIQGGVTASSYTGSFIGHGSAITGVISASFATSASYATQALSSSFATTASYATQALSASFATTASYALSALSSSYATTASYAPSIVEIMYFNTNTTNLADATNYTFTTNTTLTNTINATPGIPLPIGTIVGWRFSTYWATTPVGSSETGTLKLYWGSGPSEVTLSTAITWDGARTAVFSGSLSQAITAVEPSWAFVTTPNFATNPQGVKMVLIIQMKI